MARRQGFQRTTHLCGFGRAKKRPRYFWQDVSSTSQFTWMTSERISQEGTWPYISEENTLEKEKKLMKWNC